MFTGAQDGKINPWSIFPPKNPQLIRCDNICSLDKDITYIKIYKK